MKICAHAQSVDVALLSRRLSSRIRVLTLLVFRRFEQLVLVQDDHLFLFKEFSLLRARGLQLIVRRKNQRLGVLLQWLGSSRSSRTRGLS